MNLSILTRNVHFNHQQLKRTRSRLTFYEKLFFILIIPKIIIIVIHIAFTAYYLSSMNNVYENG